MMVTNSKVIESNFPVEELSSPVIFPGALQSQLIVSPNTSLVNQVSYLHSYTGMCCAEDIIMSMFIEVD